MPDFRFTDCIDGIAPEQLAGFFVGWSKAPPPETSLRLLASSAHRIIALDGDKVVGFVTAITDHVLAAYIPFLEVLPDYQGKKVGSELMRRMLQKLDGLYMVDLLCDTQVQPFYEKLGMRKSVGMMVRRYENQAGK